MTQQDAGLHPVSYAVWYEHVAGENTRLSAHIERLLAQGDPISEVTTLALFNAHIAAIDPAAAEQLAAAIEKVMADMSNSAAQVGNDAEQFGAALARWTNVLSRPGPESVTGSALKAVLQNTQQMQGAIESLQSRLDESRGEIETLRGEIGRSRCQGHRGFSDRSDHGKLIRSSGQRLNNLSIQKDADGSHREIVCGIDSDIELRPFGYGNRAGRRSDGYIGCDDIIAAILADK